MDARPEPSIEDAAGRARWASARAAMRRQFSDCADLLLPRACALCERVLLRGEYGFCDPCFDDLPGRTAARCPICGLPAAGAASPAAPAGCHACRRHPPAFDATTVLADYAPPLDHLVTALKFRRQLALARALGEALSRLLAAAPTDRSVLVTAVPLGRQRLLERGFNQSQLVAQVLARRLGLAAPRLLLRRRRDTPPQAGLSLDNRQQNLRDAFECVAEVEGRIVWLVDDVMTTGATLDACARALKQAGAAGVTNIVAARTP